jgi:DNA-binding transcriptional ArsR family regulator
MIDFSNCFDIIRNMKTKAAVQSLAALAQETRLSIYRALVEQGPSGLAAGALAERLGVANATLSFHLKELANAGLIVPRQDGRFIYYAANYDAMSALLEYLTANCCAGEPCSATSRTAPARRRTTA